MTRKYIPDADITTDIIVGFPSETDEEFKETLGMVKEVRFTTAFMFAYSVREGTRAAEMTDDIPGELKLNRLKELIELQTAITPPFMRFEAKSFRYWSVDVRRKRTSCGWGWIRGANGFCFLAKMQRQE
jgi:tRNA A37 methylthiotransferase MiaB